MRMEIVFTFPDTQSAIAAESALLAEGVEVRVMSRPSALGEGCGICLRVDTAARERAGSVLKTGGIEVDGIYSKVRENGKTLYAVFQA